ncbi:GNAT family N-acetyltransferase [Paenibacillus silvae]|uniref:GNAT family N-acetyltransferase n=1 Tax=Paenibacillus silvae TaxID=1325358 RepID=UPI00259FE8B4|nr:GNAT family N-acetyltransferase [Paenibacillus silvae]MDM5277454.1 GNAT family N-acetyltransferase [Paenibacillus silvae]
MTTNISISQADPYSLVGAKLNLMAVGDMAHSIAGSSNQGIVDATFRMLWQSKNNRFSHEYAYEAKMGEKSLGMITCLPVTVLEQLVSSTAKQLFSYRKLGLIAYNLLHLRSLFSTLTLKEGFEGEYHIATLAAMPESRGMGIGSQLIHHAEEQAITQGYNLSSLTVKKENHLAAKLYAKLGYNITSEVVKPTVSLYRMVKKLN